MATKAASGFDAVGIGNSVRAHRKLAGMTQAQLADRAGLAFETISRVEGGREPPSLRTLLALANALDASLDTLMGRDGHTAFAGRFPGGHSMRVAERSDVDLERLIQAASQLEPEALRYLTLFLKAGRPRRGKT